MTGKPYRGQDGLPEPDGITKYQQLLSNGDLEHPDSNFVEACLQDGVPVPKYSLEPTWQDGIFLVTGPGGARWYQTRTSGGRREVLRIHGGRGQAEIMLKDLIKSNGPSRSKSNRW